MAINKVVYNDEILLDLSEDTVKPENLMNGETAHDANGNAITGNVVTSTIRVNPKIITGYDCASIFIDDEEYKIKSPILSTAKPKGYCITDTYEVPNPNEFSRMTNIFNYDNVKGKYLWTMCEYDEVSGQTVQTFMAYTVAYFPDGSSGGGAEIDDSTIATDKVWSSNKINSLIGDVEGILAELIGG